MVKNSGSNPSCYRPHIQWCDISIAVYFFSKEGENLWRTYESCAFPSTSLERIDSLVSSEDANISYLAHGCNYRGHVLFMVPKKTNKTANNHKRRRKRNTIRNTLAIYVGCVSFKLQLCPRFTWVPNVAHHVRSICSSAACCWRSSGRWRRYYKPTRLSNRHLETFLWHLRPSKAEPWCFLIPTESFLCLNLNLDGKLQHIEKF